MIFQKLMKGLAAQKQSDRRAELYRNLIRHEAKIGGKLFGPIPEGGHREFFCLDQYTWVWYEEWTDKAGQRQTKTTRYEFRGNDVLKSVNGSFQPLGVTEAKRLREAIQQYGAQVYQDLYSKIPR
jgi:hypothetical protein